MEALSCTVDTIMPLNVLGSTIRLPQDVPSPFEGTGTAHINGSNIIIYWYANGFEPMILGLEGGVANTTPPVLSV